MMASVSFCERVLLFLRILIVSNETRVYRAVLTLSSATTGFRGSSLKPVAYRGVQEQNAFRRPSRVVTLATIRGSRVVGVLFTILTHQIPKTKGLKCILFTVTF